MPEPKEFLFGKIALREGAVTREQLYDCLLAQERNPARTLGEIMIRRRILTAQQVRNLLDIQQKALDAAKVSDIPGPRSALLGKLIVEKGLATDFQVNECLRLQGRMEEMGIIPVPPLGEILLRRGYLNKGALETAMQYQNLSLYSCPSCNAPIEAHEDDGTEYNCPKCRQVVPSILAKLAASLHEALEVAADHHDVGVPAEVRTAEKTKENHFGKYILVNEVGRGGAGVVWRAWQKDVNRFVALKMLSHDSETKAGVSTPFGDAEDVRRFYNEIRAVAELKHDNIVPIYDFAIIDNHFYYAMSLVKGKTLDDLVRDGYEQQDTTVRKLDEAVQTLESIRPKVPAAPPGPAVSRLPLAEALRIMRDIARAVHFAHTKGVYHRDIKPSNIIIARDGTPWITDFGLAKVVRLGDSAYVKGVIMGTPYYMPPEQAEGDMEKVDHLSDVYSLGAVLYEAVTGVCPFSERSPDTVIEILPKALPELPKRLRSDLPDDIARILDKAMQKEKNRRYPSAAAFAEDLDRFLRGADLQPEPVGARPARWHEKITGIFKRR